MAAANPVRRKIRSFLVDYLDGRDETDAIATIQAARQAFDHDAAFRSMLYDEAVAVFIADEFRALMTERRPSPTDRQLNLRARQIASMLFESIDRAAGKRKALLKLTREELLHTIEERERQIAGMERYTNYLRDLAAGLAPGETVEERYDDDEMQAIWDSHFS